MCMGVYSTVTMSAAPGVTVAEISQSWPLFRNVELPPSNQCSEIERQRLSCWLLGFSNGPIKGLENTVYYCQLVLCIKTKSVETWLVLASGPVDLPYSVALYTHLCGFSHITPSSRCRICTWTGTKSCTFWPTICRTTKPWQRTAVAPAVLLCKQMVCLFGKCIITCKVTERTSCYIL